jgi:hypothetical protein
MNAFPERFLLIQLFPKDFTPCAANPWAAFT